MSCRVLKRSMEHFVLNAVVNFARQNGFRFLKGEYIATAKNSMVKEHYLNLGFTKANEMWILNVEDYENKKSFINSK